MRRAIVSQREGVSHPTDDAALVEAKKAPEKVLWLDIQKPAEEDFRLLLDRLGCAGFGWLRPEGVRRELDRIAATWRGPQ